MNDLNGIFMNAARQSAAQKWILQAHHDLEMAEKNIAIGGYDVAAFLAHQSVEKLLKGICIIEGKKIPKTHFIDELGELLGLSGNVVEQILELSADYTLARYPDVSDEVPFKQYDESVAREKVAAAKSVFAALIERYQTCVGWNE